MSEWFIRQLDRQADWIARKLHPRNQRRVGLLMIYLALPFHAYGLVADEPPIIYQMSALALTLTGLGAIIAAVPSE